MIKERASDQTNLENQESFINPINEDNKLVLQHQIFPKTKRELKQELRKERKAIKDKLISSRKTVMQEIVQAVADHRFDKENHLKLAIEIANKAVEDKIFTQEQINGRMEEAMDSMGIKYYTRWKPISKKEFLNNIDEPVEESKNAFLAGDTLIIPTRVYEGEVRKDQTPNFNNAYKRGVIRGFNELEANYITKRENIKNECEREKFHTNDDVKKERLETQKNKDLEDLLEKRSKDYNELFHKATAVFKIYKDKQLRTIIKKSNKKMEMVINRKPVGSFENK